MSSIKSKLALFEKLSQGTRPTGAPLRGSASGPVLEGPSLESSSSSLSPFQHDTAAPTATDTNERRGGPEWVPDAHRDVCQACSKKFSFWTRKHHCRGCGDLYCAACIDQNTADLSTFGYDGAQPVCPACFRLHGTPATRARARSRTPPPRVTNKPPKHGYFAGIKEEEEAAAAATATAAAATASAAATTTSGGGHVSKHDEQLQQLKRVTGALTQEVSEKSELLTRARDENARLVAQQQRAAEEHRATKAEMASELQRTNEQMETMRAQLAAQEQQSATRVAALQAANDESVGVMTGLRGENATLKTTMGALQAEVAKLRESAAAKAGDDDGVMAGLRGDNATLKTTMGALEVEVARLKERVAQVIRERDDATATTATKTARDDDEVKAEIRELRHQLSLAHGYRDQVKMLEGVMTQQQAQLKSLLAAPTPAVAPAPVASVAPAPVDYSACEARLAEERETGERLKAALEMHKSRRDADAQKLKALEADLADTGVAYEAELERTMGKLQAAEHRHRDVSAQLLRAQQKEARLLAQMEQQMAEANKASKPVPALRRAESERLVVAAAAKQRTPSPAKAKRLAATSSAPSASKLKRPASVNPFLARKKDLESATGIKAARNAPVKAQRRAVEPRTPPRSPPTRPKKPPQSAPPRANRSRLAQPQQHGGGGGGGGGGGNGEDDELARMRVVHEERMARLAKLLTDDGGGKK